ncbi:MAG TPA: methionine--tRNA ligase subunit beta, partial [Balneolaceae bacterium]|nr:methionine--tRNA ligase subunit beta [Balneolaceae bacterium]
DFSWEGFQNKVNSELADILGNFVYRTTSFTENFADGQVPELENPSQEDLDTLAQIEGQKQKIADSYDAYRMREALAETMQLARIGNKYFTEMEPWRTRKEDMTTCKNTLHVCLQLCAALSVLFEPVMPRKMQQLRNQLGVPEDASWDDVRPNMLAVGQIIKKGEILFEKIEDEEIEKQLKKLEKSANSSSDYEPLKEEIDYNDFAKLDLRAGKILQAEKIEKSNKLIKIKVDLGFEHRTVVSGIANDFDAEALVGQKVCVVANLAPVKLMGIESNGMILMAEEADGSLKFVETDAEPGSTVK